VGESSGDLSAVHHGAAKTDAEGKTPAPFAYGALLLTDYAYKATDDVPDPDSGECRVASYDYRYDVRVTAEGYEAGVIEGLDPDEAWVEKTVALKKQ